MTDYSMSAYELAVVLYEKSGSLGVPLHNRPKMIRDAWISVAQRLIATGTAPMDAIATFNTAH
jgi:hypothetical protein